MSYHINDNGYYGEFGGAFIPELLHHQVDQLQKCYRKILAQADFKDALATLLKDYVGRPTPLYFATRLSAQYEANILLKREDLNHTGAHKINNTLGQILLARHLGKTRIIAETGAGQHGVATAAACAKFGMECMVYMGATDMERQRPNVARMQMMGAKVIPVHAGTGKLKDATNEAIRDWINHPETTFYIIGSVVGPAPYPDLVARLQSIISEELRDQLMASQNTPDPDCILACIGGGSNAAGIFYHYLDSPSVALIAAEAGGKGPASGLHAATCSQGSKGILHGSHSLLLQDKYGQVKEPYSISAGMDYPGVGPLHAHLFTKGRLQVYAVADEEAIHAAFNLSQLEGILPAIESAHALALLNHIETKGKTIVVNLSGRGDKDLDTYTSLYYERLSSQ